MADLEDRIIELETRLSYQDDMLQKLDDVVIAQGRELDDLKQQLIRLKQQLWELTGVTGVGPESPPPHY